MNIQANQIEIATMKDWEVRERNWTKFRTDVAPQGRKGVLHGRLLGRLLPTS